MAEELRRASLVVATVNIRDGDLCQLFVRNVVEAHHVYAVHLADGRFVAHTERAHAAVLAEVVMVLPGVEQILSELCLARQQAKALRFHHCRPEACSSANGAIASVGALRQIDVGFEFDGAAVTTAVVCLQHD